MSLTIIGLGPAHPDDITRRAWQTLEQADTVYLRTERHPAVPHLPTGATYHSFDALYDQTEQFEDVYQQIVDTLLQAAKDKPIVYAVPGDPFNAESTVTKLVKAAKAQAVDVVVHSGVSFIEPTCAALELDALDGLQLIDALDVAAMHHPPLNPDYPVLLAQVYNRTVANNVKLTLMNQYPDDFAVTLVHHAGGKAQLESLPLYEIDRSEQIDHMTTLFVPAIGQHSSFESFQETIAHLRAPEGCPWDKKQTHESLRPYLLEEAHEVLDAINDDDPDKLMDELGDLMLQIVLHTQIATEFGEFQMADVMRNVNAKMIRRHPHVWGDVNADDADAVVTNWEAIKQAEKAAKGESADAFISVLDDVPDAFSALMKAQKYARKAAKQGFDYDDIDGVKAKIHEELTEFEEAATEEEREKEAGDILFAVVDLLRWHDLDAETVLSTTNRKFARRFRYVEQRVHESGKPMREHTLEELDVFWNAAKAHDV